MTKSSIFSPILIAGSVILMVGFAIRASFGVFQIPIAAEFGWGGAMYDITGGYGLVWWIGVGVGAFSALVHLPIRENRFPIAAT